MTSSTCGFCDSFPDDPRPSRSVRGIALRSLLIAGVVTRPWPRRKVASRLKPGALRTALPLSPGSAIGRVLHTSNQEETDNGNQSENRRTGTAP